MAHQLHIPYGDDFLLATAMPKEELDAEVRFLVTAKRYEPGKLTSGQPGRLCGKGRADLLLGLPRIGVSLVNQRGEEANVQAAMLCCG